MTVKAAALAGAAFLLGPPALAKDDACRAALDRRVMECATPCIERAKAAVDPEIRNRVLGRGCIANCMKLEMFAGHTCPNP